MIEKIRDFMQIYVNSDFSLQFVAVILNNISEISSQNIDNC